jgi:hypothetical protein
MAADSTGFNWTFTGNKVFVSGETMLGQTMLGQRARKRLDNEE